MSDLHLEFYNKGIPFLDIPELETDIKTVLLLAGDIHVGDRAFRGDWLGKLSAQFAHICYVLGNHEHYKSSVDVTGAKICAAAKKQGIKNLSVLENGTFENPEMGFRIIGGTMWTDYNKGNPVTMYQAKKVMNDYRKIRTDKYCRRFTPDYALIKHIAFKQFLVNEMSNSFDGDTVVMTHHAPHRLSADEQHRDSFHEGGSYHSDLSELILDHPSIKCWVHGHMHSTSDYMIGDCRIIANPFGYYGIKTNYEFNANLVIAL
jgi:hypothetical protein